MRILKELLTMEEATCHPQGNKPLASRQTGNPQCKRHVMMITMSALMIRIRRIAKLSLKLHARRQSRLTIRCTNKSLLKRHNPLTTWPTSNLPMEGHRRDHSPPDTTKLTSGLHHLLDTRITTEPSITNGHWPRLGHLSLSTIRATTQPSAKSLPRGVGNSYYSC